MAWTWNAAPEDCIYYDCETQSLSDLRKDGLNRYVANPSTRISIAAFIYGDRKWLWILPGRTPSGVQAPHGWDLHIGPEPPAEILALIADGKVLCAHNAEFDKRIWDKCVRIEALWTDSMPMARSAGLPGGLEKCCDALFGEKKDARGYALINMLCKAKVQGATILYPICTAQAWTAFSEYCCKDVVLLSRLYVYVYAFRDSELLRVDKIINDRGIPVDAAMAGRLCLVQEELVRKRGDQFASITELEAADARSGKKVMDWLESIGVKIPVNAAGKRTLERKELNRLFKHPDAFVDGPNDELSGAIEALKLRIEITRATAGKALAIVRNVDNTDWRVRGQIIFHGAHTGRWTGRGIQPHNFPKGVDIDIERMVNILQDVDFSLSNTLEQFELEAIRVQEEARKKDPEASCTASDVMATLLRPCIAAYNPAARVVEGDLSIADFGAIEARVLAWLMDDDPAIEEFWKWKADPYSVLATDIFKRPITKKDVAERFLGKALELGCGYGMGWRKFELYCLVNGLDLVKLGVDTKNVVDLYRKKHPKIVEGWGLLHDACIAAVEGKEVLACKCRFYCEDGNMIIQLPSGRRMIYRNARVEDRVPGYAKMFSFQCDPVPTFVFDHPHGYEGFLYGGRCAENITQAVARDVLRDPLIISEDRGLNPIFHCHDEIVAHDPRTEELVRIMSTNSPWNDGLPILVEGFRYYRYVKGAPKDKGVFECVGLNGEVR